MNSDARLDSGAPSKLQARLAAQILEHIRANEFAPATHLAEAELCRQFRVSRSPVRGALALLERHGHVEHVPRRGYFTRDGAAGTPVPVPHASDDDLYLTIAEDRVVHRLPGQVSEADLLRRYDVPKGELHRALQRLLREGLVERLPGRGWLFAPVLNSKETHDESYRFRLAIEPYALFEPGYRLDAAAAAECERKHHRILDGSVRQITAIELFDMNAEFHELLAAGSGNRFFLQAIQQQNRLRRFVNYHWTYGPERVFDTCREHLAVLEAVKSGNLSWAATLLRRHLEISASVSPYQEADGDQAPVPPQHVIRLR